MKLDVEKCHIISYLKDEKPCKMDGFRKLDMDIMMSMDYNLNMLDMPKT